MPGSAKKNKISKKKKSQKKKKVFFPKSDSVSEKNDGFQKNCRFLPFLRVFKAFRRLAVSGSAGQCRAMPKKTKIPKKKQKSPNKCFFKKRFCFQKTIYKVQCLCATIVLHANNMAYMYMSIVYIQHVNVLCRRMTQPCSILMTASRMTASRMTTLN